MKKRAWPHGGTAIITMACAFFAMPAGASAADICVDPQPQWKCDRESSFVQNALNAASNLIGFDRVRIGPGTYEGPFSYANPDPVEIVGAGSGETVLTAPDLPPPQPPFVQPPVMALRNFGCPLGHAIRIADLGVQIRGTRAGVWLEGAQASRVTVEGDSTATGAIGVLMQRAPVDLAKEDPKKSCYLLVPTDRIDSGFDHGSIKLLAPESIGIWAESGSTMSDSTVEADIGVRTDVTWCADVVQRQQIRCDVPSPVDLLRSRIEARYGVLAAGGGKINIHSTLIRLLPPGSSGLCLAAPDSIAIVGSAPGFDTTISAEHLTVAGAAIPNQIFGCLDGDGAPTSLTVDNSLVYGVTFGLVRLGLTNTTFGDYVYHNLGPGHFENAADGLFRLVQSSPLIDIGKPEDIGSDESPRDGEGKPRILDGNGDCEARRDPGAFEYMPTTLARVSASAGTGATGQPIRFEGFACDPDPSATLEYDWSFDDGGHASGRSVLHAFDAPGEHSANLTVTSSNGAVSPGSATARTVIGAATLPGELPAPTQVAGASRLRDTVAPTVRRPGVRPRRFRAAASGASIARSVGSSVRYFLAEDATVTFTIERLSRGRTVGLPGTFTHRGRKGRNKFRFTGRLAGKRLNAGRYRLVAVPTDAAGNRGTRARASFEIVRR